MTALYMILFLLLLFLTACRGSDGDLPLQLQNQIDQIAGRLESIEDYQQLRKTVPLLKEEFLELAKLMLLAKEKNIPLNDQKLYRAFTKIGSIEGGNALLREAMRPGRELLYEETQAEKMAN